MQDCLSSCRLCGVILYLVCFNGMSQEQESCNTKRQKEVKSTALAGHSTADENTARDTKIISAKYWLEKLQTLTVQARVEPLIQVAMLKASIKRMRKTETSCREKQILITFGYNQNLRYQLALGIPCEQLRRLVQELKSHYPLSTATAGMSAIKYLFGATLFPLSIKQAPLKFKSRTPEVMPGRVIFNWSLTDRRGNKRHMKWATAVPMQPIRHSAAYRWTQTATDTGKMTIWLLWIGTEYIDDYSQCWQMNLRSASHTKRVMRSNKQFIINLKSLPV